MSDSTRVMISEPPFTELNEGRPWWDYGRWAASWITLPEISAHLEREHAESMLAELDEPTVMAFRCPLNLAEDSVIRVHVSADERYALFVDGERIGRGPERGDGEHWFFESYDLSLTAGEHMVVAIVWHLGQQAPFAQLSVQPGFIFAAEGAWSDLLNTGVAAWEVKRVTGIRMISPGKAWGTGANVAIHAAEYPWGIEHGKGTGWTIVKVTTPGCCGPFEGRGFGLQPQRLRPAMLPAMIEQPRQLGRVRHAAVVPTSLSVDDLRTIVVDPAMDDPALRQAFTAMLSGQQRLTIEPNKAVRIIIDLENYYCGYPVLVTSGGAASTIRVRWAESLYEPRHADEETANLWSAHKGNRAAVDGKYFVGEGDTFYPDGGEARRFETLWWQAGRYVAFYIETGEDPLAIDAFSLIETRYPLECEAQLECDLPDWPKMREIMVRGMQMCSHETYMDCPYYEQLMYVGDTRLEVLTTYTMTTDARLPQKAIAAFDWSRLASGMTQSRYPCRMPQVIPPFSLWWVGMVHDFARWRDEADFVKSMMPGMRAILEGWLTRRDETGMIRSPEGWNFVDWCWGKSRDFHEEVGRGVPPQGATGLSGIHHWQMVYILDRAAELEETFGEPLLAKRWREIADALHAGIESVFWDESRQLYADEPEKKAFSEHAQCLAILSGRLDPSRQANLADRLTDPAEAMTPTTIYFSHYLLEAWAMTGRIDALFHRLEAWQTLIQHDLKTTPETPEPSRSDCHAWGAHPLYHLTASVAGVQPLGFGFQQVRIAPQLGPLRQLNLTCPTPRGWITIDLQQNPDDPKNTLTGTITLPESMHGHCHLPGQTPLALQPGENAIQ